MATTEQIQAAIQRAQAAGDTQAVAALQAGPAGAQTGPTREQVSNAFYRAKAAGDEDAARHLIGYIQQNGMTLAPMSADQLNAAFQQQNAQNVAAQPWYQTALQGAGKAFVDTGRGIGELVGAISPQQVADQRQADQALMDTGAGKLGYGVGTLAQFALPVGDAFKAVPLLARGAKIATAIPRLTEAGTALGRAATLGELGGKGAALEGLQPVTSDESRGVNALVGGAANLAGAGAGKLLGAGGKFVLNRLAGGTERALDRKAAGALLGAAADPAAVRGALATKPLQFVPGSNPTLGTLTGDPGLLGLQRTMQSMSPEFNNSVTMQQLGNNAARAKYIRGLFNGADQSAVDAADAAREAATTPLRNAAMGDTGADLSRVVSNIDQRIADNRGNSAAQRVLKRVRDQITEVPANEGRLAQAKQVVQDALDASDKASGLDYQSLTAAKRAINSVQRGHTTIDDAFDTIDALSAKSPAVSQVLDTAAGHISPDTVIAPVQDIRGIYNARKFIDMLLGGQGEDSSVARGIRRELMDIKNGMDEAASAASPNYAKYLDAYRNLSKPVDQAQVGQYLFSKAAPVADVNGNPTFYPSAISRILGNPDALVQSATGFGKASAQRSLTPSQLAGLSNLTQDLGRQASISTGRAVGSNTAQNLFGASSIQSDLGPLAALAITHEPVTALATGIVNAMRKQFGAKAAQVAQQAMLDPGRAFGLIQSLEPTARDEFLRLAGPYALRLSGSATGAQFLNSARATNQPAPQPAFGQP